MKRGGFVFCGREMEMRISVQVHGHLRSTSAVGPDQREYHAQPGCTVRDLLGNLNIWEVEVRRVLRNGQEVRLDSKVRSRDRLEFFS